MFLQHADTLKMGILGTQTFILKDKDGNIKKLWNENRLGKFLFKLGFDIRLPFITGSYGDKKIVRNLITYAGYAGMASRLNGSGAEAAFTYLGVGIGTTAAATANTTLESEIVDSGLERAAATCTRITTAQTNDTAKLDKTWSVTGAKAVTECGALNAGSTGTLLGRQVFSAINVANGDSLQIIYTFQILV
jgi:hypothetical protein